MAEQNNNQQASTSFADKYRKNTTRSTSKLNTSDSENQSPNTPNNDELKEKSAKKAVDPQKRALAQYIYLIRGVDAGRNAWYYVLVERLKVQLFLKALNDEVIHLEKYGKILYSAYGDEPPANVTQAIKDEYGIS